MAIVTQRCDQHLRMSLHACGPDKHLQCNPQRKIQRREQRHPSQRPLQLDRLLGARKGIPRGSDWISQFPNLISPPHYLSPLHVVFFYLIANFNLAIPFSPTWYCPMEVPFISYSFIFVFIFLLFCINWLNLNVPCAPARHKCDSLTLRGLLLLPLPFRNLYPKFFTHSPLCLLIYLWIYMLPLLFPL